MKARFALVPIVLVAGAAAYVAFHPGVAYAEPRMAAGPVSPLNQAGTYVVDKDHCNLYFEITHLGLSKVHGRFGKFSGKIVEDPSDLSKSGVEFAIQTESVDTAVAARDAHLRTADFFEVAKYPEITFKSTKIEKKGNGYVATGDLTIKGKTKSIAIPFKHYGPLTLTVGDMSTRVGIVAEPIVIKRSEFGVGSAMKLPDGTEGAGDDVTVRISLEGIREK